MSLTARQVKCYQNTVTIIRPATAISGDGSVGNQTYSVVASNVSCHYKETRNDSDPMGAGRLKKRSQDTEDLTHCAIDVDLQDGDLLYVSLTGSPETPFWAKVQGEPTKVYGSSVRVARKQMVATMTMDLPPVGAVALI